MVDACSCKNKRHRRQQHLVTGDIADSAGQALDDALAGLRRRHRLPSDARHEQDGHPQQDRQEEVRGRDADEGDGQSAGYEPGDADYELLEQDHAEFLQKHDHAKESHERLKKHHLSILGEAEQLLKMCESGM